MLGHSPIAPVVGATGPNWACGSVSFLRDMALVDGARAIRWRSTFHANQSRCVRGRVFSAANRRLTPDWSWPQTATGSGTEASAHCPQSRSVPGLAAGLLAANDVSRR